MTWIKTVPYAEASGRLKTLYDRIKGPDGAVDNVMAVHSLRPHTMEGHMALYKHVLHHSANTVPKWFLETLGVYVSALNGCAYCVDHHFAGLKRLLDDDERAEDIWTALNEEDFVAAFDRREEVALQYAEALNDLPPRVTEEMIEAMREAGWDDGEILEINQVCAYFAYVNRTVLGLGCDTDGEVLGLSPSETDDPDDWSHR